MSKKTLEQITQQQQHYLIALKANQLTLYLTLTRLHQSGTRLTQTQTVDTSHNRQMHRRISTYAAPPQLQRLWKGLKTLIWVERWSVRGGQTFAKQLGYISNLELKCQSISPAYLAALEHRKPIALGARCPFEEDHARPGGNAPVIWAILNCFVINIVRQLAYRTIPQGIRALTNQVQQVYAILTQGFPPPK